MCDFTAKKTTRIIASQKSGIAMPTLVPNVTARSRHVPGLRPATIPAGMPITKETNIAPNVRPSVTGKRLAMPSATDWLPVNNGRPRSPRTACVSQRQQRLVEVELVSKADHGCRVRLGSARQRLRGITGDQQHECEHDERDEQEERHEREQSPDDERAHALVLLAQRANYFFLMNTPSRFERHAPIGATGGPPTRSIEYATMRGWNTRGTSSPSLMTSCETFFIGASSVALSNLPARSACE